MDDETILSYGLINYLIENQNDVNLLTFCGKSRKTDPAFLTKKRIDVFHSNISILNNKAILLNYYDLSLTPSIVNKHIKEHNDLLIAHYYFLKIYTHFNLA